MVEHLSGFETFVVLLGVCVDPFQVEGLGMWVLALNPASPLEGSLDVVCMAVHYEDLGSVGETQSSDVFLH